MSTDSSHRRKLLDDLRARKLAQSNPAPPQPASPDARVLVPASSPSRPAPLIPSSNIARAKPPPTPPKTNGIDLALYSPNSPQPLSRLKKRYDPDASPSKPANASHAPSPSSSSAAAGPSTKPRPKAMLVQAARAHHDQDKEDKYRRLRSQFKTLERADIMQALDRFTDMDGVMAHLGALSDRAVRLPPTTPAGPTASFAAKLGQFAYSGTNGSARSSLGASSLSSFASGAASASSTPPQGTKRRKNEKSTIYAKRDPKKAKRRDPDDDSEAEASGHSDEGSDAWSGDERGRKKRRGSDDEVDAEGAALKAFNEAEADVLTGTIACSEEQAAKIVGLRPFDDVDDVFTKLNKARGVSFKLFEQYTEIMEGYVQIDACLNRCEAIAADIANTHGVWKAASTLSDSVTGTPRSDGLNDVKVDVDKVSELLRSETDMRKRKILSSYIRTQPELLSEGTILKDYQLLGVNWLNLLYSRRIGCILADEMGLGKTIQVIAFLAYLKAKGTRGPHMIFVPASTLENWTREFERFAPDIDVQTYYGTQSERGELRDELKHKFRAGQLEVVLASYTQVQSADDLGFFRKKIQFETCVYDEAHALKSFNTKRYQDLVSIKPKWRLLLTGTPVQNNLQELVSLLMFIHKDIFTDAEPYLRAIFKVKSSGQTSLLSQARVSRARTMLTPFVLRRRKAAVLTLPPKIETTEECEMTSTQQRLYRDTLRRSRKVIREMNEEAIEAAGEDDGEKKPKAKKNTVPVDKNSSANIIMDLRKAASHPLLFRRLYTSAKVNQIARACLNTPTWCDSKFEYVVEDLEIMSDAEIHHFVSEHDELAHFALDESAFLEGGKVRALKTHINRCQKEGKRMLLFSQFTMILDILQVVLKNEGVRFVRLDGGTRTDERQGLVDEFNEDPDITVFLLSTKAGGVGINLTAASVVVIFDQDFNPHNDRQAADRAYRIGQEREVEVIKLISKDSIDEDILSIGLTKLQLDDMVGHGAETSGTATPGAAAVEGQDDNTAKDVKKSLLRTLRSKFEAEGDAKAEDDAAAKAEDEGTPREAGTQVKRAAGVKRA